MSKSKRLSLSDLTTEENIRKIFKEKNEDAINLITGVCGALDKGGPTIKGAEERLVNLSRQILPKLQNRENLKNHEFLALVDIVKAFKS